MRNRATPDVVVPEVKVAGTGFEREPFSLGNSHIAGSDSAKCSALLPSSEATHDEALAAVVEAWPNLPAALKTGILAIVRVG